MYDCNDAQVLWIASVNEPPTITQIAEACNYDVRWWINLVDRDEWCLRLPFTPTGGIPDLPHQNIAERVQLMRKGSPQNVVDSRRTLDDFLCEIMRWQLKQYTNNSIWLYHMVDGESGLRRSLLYAGTPVDTFQTLGGAGQDAVIYTDVSLERHWCWEDPESTQFLYGIRELWGDIINPAYMRGTANGRICRFTTKDEATKFTADGDIISEMWIGIKEDEGCGLDEWMPAMDLNEGFTAFTDSGTITGIVDPVYGDIAARTDFSLDASRIKRIGIELFQAFPSANYQQWRGQYIVLLRCRVSTPDTSVTIQADSGWRTTRLKQLIGSPVVVDGANGTDYRMIQLGVATMPEDMYRLCASDVDRVISFDSLDNYSIGIEASREAGIGFLYMTDLYLIPYEHSAVIRNLNPDTEFINFIGMWFNIINNEDDTSQLRTYTQREPNPGEFLLSPDNDFSPDINDFSLPKRGSRIVAALNVYDQGSRHIIHQKDFEWLPAMDVFSRWLSYRND